jgi:hypothetical protein
VIDEGVVGEPELCTCGHYLFIHKGRRCTGWRRPPLRFWRLTLSTRCRCRRNRA